SPQELVLVLTLTRDLLSPRGPSCQGIEGLNHPYGGVLTGTAVRKRNLVRLIGFCCEGDKRLLVYEHVVNGSLDAHLFQQSSAAAVATALDWSKRYRIAVGVARGLCYLHQSCRECIIHCDIKPENILLDASFAPKIADFGLAAFVGRDFSR
ncbi:hypothetical protein ACJX0J_027417, partial [Zea mays]